MTSSTVTAVAGAGEATRPGTSGPADPANRRVEVVNNACPGGLFGVQQTAAADTPFSGAGVAAVAGVGALALGAVLINNDDDNNSGGSTGGTE
jgi:hypothetical protein